MVVAGGPDGQNDRFQLYQFMFATTLIHEVGGHLLYTLLCNGRLVTPPHISANGWGTDNTGESGRYLEDILYGGTLAWYKDPAQGNDQVKELSIGCCLLLTRSGWNALLG